MIEREGDGRFVERMVGLRLVLDRLACQPGKQFIDVSNALNAPELLSISLEPVIQWMVGGTA